MTVTRSLAAAAMLAAAAVGAAPAWADTGFSGHYTYSDTDSAGSTNNLSSDVTPCGDGCVKILVEGGTPITAHLINGQWQWDEVDNPAVCPDGTQIPAVTDGHSAIDATTLRGTVVLTYKKAACGHNDVGKTFTNTIVFTKAAPPPPPQVATMSGHYIRTVTNSVGQSIPGDWYFTPCGDGCAAIANTPSEQPWGQAHLVNGQWTIDSQGDAGCPDGSTVPDARSNHYTWDPNTLAGTVQVTVKVAACGEPVGRVGTANLQLKQASQQGPEH